MVSILKRGLKLFAGSLLVLAGFILVPVPGPFGLPVIFAGLALLATELAHARWLKRRLKNLIQKYSSGLSPRFRYLVVSGFITFYLVLAAAWLWNTGIQD